MAWRALCAGYCDCGGNEMTARDYWEEYKARQVELGLPYVERDAYEKVIQSIPEPLQYQHKRGKDKTNATAS